MKLVKRTTLSDNELIYDDYLYCGEHALESLVSEKIYKPKEYAMKFCKSGVEEVLYKTRIQTTSSAKLIKIFVKVKK